MQQGTTTGNQAGSPCQGLRDLAREREEFARETAKLERILDQSEAENEELRRQGARVDSPGDQELMRKLRVLRACVANCDVKIKELEKEVAKRALIDPLIGPVIKIRRASPVQKSPRQPQGETKKGAWWAARRRGPRLVCEHLSPC